MAYAQDITGRTIGEKIELEHRPLMGKKEGRFSKVSTYCLNSQRGGEEVGGKSSPRFISGQEKKRKSKLKGGELISLHLTSSPVSYQLKTLLQEWGEGQCWDHPE